VVIRNQNLRTPQRHACELNLTSKGRQSGKGLTSKNFRAAFQISAEQHTRGGAETFAHTMSRATRNRSARFYFMLERVSG
jgi:hypothetical protein